MSIEEYKNALKLGQKVYRQATMQGNYPYLPVLEDMVSFDNVEKEVSLGLVEIPMDLIVGTKSSGRTNSFASNFMPLLSLDSEFAMKWSSLSNLLQEEGLRDPVRAYEYMNHFYIQEGNKRVSVMKYFGSASIPGYVTRIVPKKNDSKENLLYYEYMAFYQMSQINYMVLSEIGAYKKLQAYVGKKKDEEWTDDEKKLFHSFYIRFEKAYRAKAGQRLPIPVGDAILIYLNIYPYEQSKNQMPTDFKENIDKIWEEFLVHKQEQAIALSMTPTDAGKKNILSKLFTETKLYKIAFIHDKTADSSGWTYGHELGRAHLQQMFKERLQIQHYDNVNVNDLQASVDAITKAIKDGNRIIFTTTPKLMKASLQVAVQYPDVKILNCSLNTMHPSIRSYYGRMYEAKFLMGVLAGAVCESNQIGYIADYPIYGMIANINAFALGASMTNPNAKIYLEWSTIKDVDIRENLKKNDVCFISDRDIIIPQQASRKFGLYHEHGDKLENMATPVWHWGKFYELILRSIMCGSWKSYESSHDIKALNYWWGMSAGVIDVICSQNIPEGTRLLIELIKKNICEEKFHPFSGKIYDQDGQLRHFEDTPMAAEQIIEMDWLVKNVIGEIPSVDELTEEARQIVALQGVKKTEEEELLL